MNYHPLVYEVQTRCWLRELSPKSELISLANVPDEALSAIKAQGADYLWLMGVWQTGKAGRLEALNHPDLQQSYREALADFVPADVVGSPYAVAAYRVSRDFGGDKALKKFRERLKVHGLKLILDFVPNHVALDNEWVGEHPNYFIEGIADDAANGLGRKVATREGEKVFLHGRDPYFPPWTDTFELNWSEPELIKELTKLLLRLATMCDGLRCDMAMLLLKKVFAKTWGREITGTEEPWHKLISAVKKEFPSFLFLAEAYWNMEWDLTEQGFDYVYDKRLYDRLLHGDAASLRAHLSMTSDFHRKQLRFLENHDEPRAAGAFSLERHKAALVILSGLPGMWLLHHHEADGAQIKLPVQLARYPHEEVNQELHEFYQKILTITANISKGCRWVLLPVRRAWEENYTAYQFIAYALIADGQIKNIVAVNFAERGGECYLDLGEFELLEKKYKLFDMLAGVEYERDGDELRQKGLYISLPPCGFHYFAVVYGD